MSECPVVLVVASINSVDIRNAIQSLLLDRCVKRFGRLEEVVAPILFPASADAS